METAARNSPLIQILAIGFGTTVLMWGIGYVTHLPPGIVPGWMVLVLMVLAQLGGALVAGKTSPRSAIKMGIQVCLLSSILNLLILGSLLTGENPNQLIPSALIWIPGSFLLAVFLGISGGKIGQLLNCGEVSYDWLAVFVRVGVTATMLLIIAGGIVTSYGAGLAVVDWPNSFGYNMFLYPLSRMTGGIYYEHAHRLFGSLVGLTTLVITLYLLKNEERKWVKGISLLALLAVIIQGIMGGLRVTGRFTLTTNPEEVSPSITLAVIHGVFGQVFLGLLVALSIFVSRRWKEISVDQREDRVRMDITLSGLLVMCLITQLVLGAIQRHLASGLLIHISFAVVVLLIAMASGVRAWGLYPRKSQVYRLGLILMFTASIQLLLGLLAFFVTGVFAGATNPPPVEVLITTLHQAVGAVLLGLSVALMVWFIKSIPLGTETPEGLES